MLTDQDILRLAGLANLSLEEDQISSLKKDLSGIIGHFSDLKKIDTKDVPPTSQTTGLINVTRRDKIEPLSILSLNQATSGSDTQNGYFVVPGLLDKDAI